MTRIPVTILTGFLGAGKTTLLNRLIAQPGFGDTAVIINEFGEAGVDGGLVEQAGERAFAMSTGCLCCTVSGDVRLTLLRLLEDAEEGRGPAFDRIVIETTGLADPAPVLQTFMTNDYMLGQFALNGVVTLVDAINGEAALERFEEARKQVALADMLIVTKGDLARDPVSRRDVAALRSDLARRNPNARVVDPETVTAEDVFSLAAFDPAGKPPDAQGWLRFSEPHDHSHHHHSHDVNSHGDSASAYCFSASGPTQPQALDEALRVLQASFGRDLLRLKGIVDLEHAQGRPAIVHAVGWISNPPRFLDRWPDGIEHTRIVLIVAGAGRDGAPEMLKRFLPELVPFTAT